MIRIGTSGWVYGSWRERFYPKGVAQRRWLPYYAERFDTVELNATTYRLPKERQVQVWCETVPSNFRYTVKLSRLITHRRDLPKRVDEFIENYFARARCFDPQKLAQILVQFPPYLDRNDAHLDAFLGKLPREFRYVVEFRNATWFVPEVRVPLWVTRPDLAYVRYHGYGGLYVGSYPRRTLKRHAQMICGLAAEARDVYIYFNNDTDAAAPADALVLRKMLCA